jgi:hypothetical protein
MSNALNRSARLGVEALESREVPAIVNVTNTPSFTLIEADDSGSRVRIERPTSTSPLIITDRATGGKWQFANSEIGHNHVLFVGGDGFDWVIADGARIRATMHGKGGNDVLRGGAYSDSLNGGPGNDILFGFGGTDQIYGNQGNDTIFGGSSNDALFGNSSVDVLYGEAGHDFLDDGGQAGDKSDGGDGHTFFARRPVRFGTLANDVQQNHTPTCWVLAGLSAAAQGNGINLADRITYQGDGIYRVKLMNEDGGFKYQYVDLKCGWLPFEPIPNSDESWVIIFHRAIMQELDFDWKDFSSYTGGQCWEPLSFLTGRPSESHTAYAWEFTVSFLHDMRNALLQNKLVTAGTRQGNYGDGNILGNVSTAKLVGAHCYHVINVDFNTGKVTLRNPWGTDGWNCYDGDNDGIIKITLNQFMDSFDTVGIS